MVHVTHSRRAAAQLRAVDERATSLLDRIDRLTLGEVQDEAAEVERRYGLPSIRDVYRSDHACDGLDEEQCRTRTVSHFRALEQIFDELRPA